MTSLIIYKLFDLCNNKDVKYIYAYRKRYPEKLQKL